VAYAQVKHQRQQGFALPSRIAIGTIYIDYSIDFIYILYYHKFVIDVCALGFSQKAFAEHTLFKVLCVPEVPVLLPGASGTFFI
jgi:hypothetical protein